MPVPSPVLSQCTRSERQWTFCRWSSDRSPAFFMSGQVNKMRRLALPPDGRRSIEKAGGTSPCLCHAEHSDACDVLLPFGLCSAVRPPSVGAVARIASKVPSIRLMIVALADLLLQFGRDALHLFLVEPLRTPQQGEYLESFGARWSMPSITCCWARARCCSSIERSMFWSYATRLNTGKVSLSGGTTITLIRELVSPIRQRLGNGIDAESYPRQPS